MLQEERQKKIISRLEEQGFTNITFLAGYFSCSRETIRRDLETLEKQELIKKVHGGAILIHQKAPHTFQIREHIHNTEKSEIAALTAELIPENSVIAMNSGTTTHFIAQELKKRSSKLTVITLSIPIMTELSMQKNIKVVVPGGVIEPDELSLIGPIAENTLKDFHIDIAIVAPGGISLEGGITEFLNNELPIEKILLEQAETVYIVAEHQKIGQKCMLKISDLQNIKGIITDSKCPDEIVERYEREGINIIRSFSDIRKPI